MPHTVLSVDADAALRATRSAVLREAGFKVIEAAYGEDALELASEEQPTLVVLAIELAGMDGFAVSKRLKSDPRTAAIPVLHISNRGERSRDYPASLESGADAYLQAPVEPAALTTVAAALIRVSSEGPRIRDTGEVIRQQAELLRLSSDAIIVWRLGGVMLSWNRGAEQLYGYSESEALGRVTHELLRTVHPAPWPEIEAALRECGNWEGELRHIAKDGREVTVSARHQLITGADGVELILETNRDITRRKKAEEALRESDAVLRGFFDSPGMMRGFVELVDGDIVHVSCNAAAAEMYGVDRESIAGTSATKGGVSEEVVRAWSGLYEESRLTGKPVSMEYARRDARGRDRWLLATASYLGTGPSGHPRFAYTILDLTERKRAEEEVHRQRQWLQVTLKSIGDAVLATDAGGRIIFLNPVAASLTGWAEEQALGRPAHEVFRIVNERTRQEAEDIVGRVLRDACSLSLANHTVLVARDGREIPIEDSAAPIRDSEGKVLGVVLVFHDVTEKRRAREALRAERERLRLALEAAQLGAWDYRYDTGEVLWDERCARMFGVPPGEITDAEAIARIHPDDQGAVRQALAQALAGVDDGAYDCEFRIAWPDGSEHWISSHGRAYFSGDGGERRPVRFTGVNLDTTARKQTEKRFREAQKLESLGLLAGGVAHDFNNLLVGVIGNASLAQEMLEPDHPASELLDAVLRTGEQAAHLTRQMLACSGKGKFVVEPLDLSALIPEMSGLVRPSISKKIVLHFDLDPDLPLIEADRGQVQQVFMNLALNAAEAIGSHAGLIAVKTGVQHVDDRYMQLHPEAKELRRGEYVYLDVRDDGCGMDDATKARIFDPFFSTKFTGRGLGLAAVAGILRGHQGAIVVNSAPGQGTCFTVLFPPSERDAEQRPAAARSAALQGTGVVLVVDDEKLVREMAKKALERYGYTVLVADSGLAAIDLLKRHPGGIALIVLDLSMPHMSGEEALPELRKIRPEVKVVVSSGYSEAETMPLFKGQRISGFIQKPYTSAVLAEKVKLCLG